MRWMSIFLWNMFVATHWLLLVGRLFIKICGRCPRQCLTAHSHTAIGLRFQNRFALEWPFVYNVVLSSGSRPLTLVGLDLDSPSSCCGPLFLKKSKVCPGVIVLLVQTYSEPLASSDSFHICDVIQLISEFVAFHCDLSPGETRHEQHHNLNHPQRPFTSRRAAAFKHTD